MAIISTKDLDIYFERSTPRANGPLLFIGGTGGDLRNKPNQLDSPLSEHFEIISYDQRGLGQTSKPSGSYSMQQYADDAAHLLDELKIDTIPVMGVSFGGMVAQEFIKRHASRVSKLILACTSSGGDGGSSYPLHTLEEMNEEEKLETSIKINDLRITDAWIEENDDLWQSIKQQAENRNAYKPLPRNLLKQLLARKDHNTYGDLDEINIPTFLLGGKYDGIAPMLNMEKMHQKIDNSKLEFYEGGHLFLIQDTNAFQDIINWLIH
jgi:3-oxoadipate enol-lactonase